MVIGSMSIEVLSILLMLVGATVELVAVGVAPQQSPVWYGMLHFPFFGSITLSM